MPWLDSTALPFIFRVCWWCRGSADVCGCACLFELVRSLVFLFHSVGFITFSGLFLKSQVFVKLKSPFKWLICICVPGRINCYVLIRSRSSEEAHGTSSPRSVHCAVWEGPRSISAEHTGLCSRTHCSYLAEIGRDAHLHILFFFFSQSRVCGGRESNSKGFRNSCIQERSQLGVRIHWKRPRDLNLRNKYLGYDLN